MENTILRGWNSGDLAFKFFFFFEVFILLLRDQNCHHRENERPGFLTDGKQALSLSVRQPPPAPPFCPSYHPL